MLVKFEWNLTTYVGIKIYLLRIGDVGRNVFIFIFTHVLTSIEFLFQILSLGGNSWLRYFRTFRGILNSKSHWSHRYNARCTSENLLDNDRYKCNILWQIICLRLEGSYIADILIWVVRNLNGGPWMQNPVRWMRYIQPNAMVNIKWLRDA